MSDLTQIGFDRYQRFKAAADLIEGLAQGRRLCVLDVGGWDDAFASFLPGHEVTAYEGHVTPAAPLARPARSMDVVLALDVLEHVPPEERRFFLGELARVCSLACIIGFPIKSAAKAEEFVLGLTKSAWLSEHKKYGLPDPAEIENILQDLGLAFTRHPNACLPSWTAMMLLMYGVQEEGPRREINRFFNENYYLLENREPAYRYIYVCRPTAR